MLNKVFLIGHLGKDPESRFTQGGNPVTNFSIATSEKWTDKQGNKQEKTEWHNIVAWSKQAEICRDYLVKGSKVHIEGKLQTDKWTDNNGVDRWTTKVVLRQILFLGSPQGQQQEQQHQGHSGQASEPPPIGDDDVPF